jgi:hypothetical protein
MPRGAATKRAGAKGTRVIALLMAVQGFAVNPSFGKTSIAKNGRAIFSGASHAQRAAHFLHGLQKAVSLMQLREGRLWQNTTS